MRIVLVGLHDQLVVILRQVFPYNSELLAQNLIPLILFLGIFSLILTKFSKGLVEMNERLEEGVPFAG